MAKSNLVERLAEDVRSRKPTRELRRRAIAEVVIEYIEAAATPLALGRMVATTSGYFEGGIPTQSEVSAFRELLYPTFPKVHREGDEVRINIKFVLGCWLCAAINHQLNKASA